MVAIRRLGFALSVEPFLHVQLQLSDDHWVQLFKVELTNYLPCTVLDDIENALHVFLG